MHSKYMAGENVKIENRHGEVYLIRGGDYVYIPRHGNLGNTPPHRINHKANISALKDENVSCIIGVCSVGSLKKSIKPGTLVVPDDYIFLGANPTFFNEDAVHTTPLLDDNIRGMLLQKAKKLDYGVFEGGTYFQTTGPRLETKAEINMLSDYADVVGMSMASEATCACELGLRYAAVCRVDNYAHGVVDEVLDFGKIREDSHLDGGDLEPLLDLVLEELICF